MDKNDYREVIGILKSMVGVQSAHQDQLSSLFKFHTDLLGALAGKGDTDASPARTAAQETALRRAAAEIAELERLFGAGEGEGRQ